MERRKAYQDKNKFLSVLIDMRETSVAIDETCDRGMVSVTVEETGTHYHVPISGLTAKARETLADQLCGV